LHDLVAVARLLVEQQEDRGADVSPAHAPAAPAAASSVTAERRPNTMVEMMMSHAVILHDISLSVKSARYPNP
jgi:Rod binding domain-containing protein